MRGHLLKLHRWVGLAITLLLLVVGLTGAVIPWQDQIRSAVAGDVWDVARPGPDARVLSGLDLKRIAEEQTGGTVSYIQLQPDPTHAFSVFVSSAPGGPPLGYRQVLMDPYNGEIRAKLRFAELNDGAINLAPFLVKVHYSLGLGPYGQLALGIVALVWLVMSLVGVYLTWPRGANGRRFRRWLRVWRIRRGRGGRVWVHDFHRATGLWFLPMTLVFAWSAVGFNLQPVHDPVQKLMGAEGLYQPVLNDTPDAGDALSADQALIVGQELMRAQAREQGFVIRGAEALSFRPHSDLIGYYARTSLDGPTDRGGTVIWFDDSSGRSVAFVRPYGETPADVVDKATRMLHSGEMLGTPFRLLISVFALLLCAMMISSALLWLRKSGKRARKSQNKSSFLI